mmetsp:Transcript_78197/g.253215  ORF Transcript_78197/g.253215 Transcript_78197/m.253215 type:complete len:201 (-) Transcript_78197:93-695(-)
MDGIVRKPARVARAIGPGQAALTALDSMDVLALEACTIWPGLNALTMLQVAQPLALVRRPILLPVAPVTGGLVGAELALVDASAWELKLPLAVGLVITELPLVPGPTRPDVGAVPVPLVAPPLTAVLLTVCEGGLPGGDLHAVVSCASVWELLLSLTAGVIPARPAAATVLVVAERTEPHWRCERKAWDATARSATCIAC